MSDLTLIVAVVQVPRHAFAITCSQVSQAFVSLYIVGILIAK